MYFWKYMRKRYNSKVMFDVIKQKQFQILLRKVVWNNRTNKKDALSSSLFKQNTKKFSGILLSFVALNYILYHKTLLCPKTKEYFQLKLNIF